MLSTPRPSTPRLWLVVALKAKAELLGMELGGGSSLQERLPVPTGSKRRALQQEGAAIQGFVENPTVPLQRLCERVPDNQAYKEAG